MREGGNGGENLVIEGRGTARGRKGEGRKDDEGW